MIIIVLLNPATYSFLPRYQAGNECLQDMLVAGIVGSPRLNTF